MEEVLSTPLDALEGMTWPAAFRADLAAALESLGTPPDLLLLTGGPSQMAFVLDICREAVGPERVVVGSAPEFAIARGLALAGREEVRAEGFRREVGQLMHSGQISSMISEQLPLLAEPIGKLITTGMTERHVIPMFLKWREGEIETLNVMMSQIGDNINSEVLGERRQELDALVADWQNGIHLLLEKKTQPICEHWDIPAVAMRLPQVKISTVQFAAPVDASVVTSALEKVGTAVSAVVAVVIANVLLGAGTAVIAATGPFAVLFAAVFIFGAAMIGQDKIMGKAMAANIPIWTRRMALSDAAIERKIRANSAASEAKLATAISEKIVESGPAMAADIAREISKALEEKARDVELLILPGEVKKEKRPDKEKAAMSGQIRTARPRRWRGTLLARQRTPGH